MAEDGAARIAAARGFYAEELRFVARAEAQVVRAFATVAREKFLGPGPWQIMGEDRAYWWTPDGDPAHVYHNVLVAIDAGRELNNGHPQFWAHLFSRLGLRRGESVCHVGAGTGYYTAIQAEIVGADGRVTGIEVDAGLAERARANLTERANVKVVEGDGSLYEPEPVDAIIVNAGATHPAPCWLAALKPGGRMLLPLTTERDDGIVLRIERLGKSAAYAAEVISGVHIYPCAGARERDAERALVRAFAGGGQRFIRSLRRDRHEREGTCWLHGDQFCLSIDPPAEIARAEAGEVVSAGGSRQDRSARHAIAAPALFHEDRGGGKLLSRRGRDPRGAAGAEPADR
ncbi:MAG TPA: methyltransferase domain-containing protein [Acetobacteraceae bacterium]|nr:methyltransferase domain-containing protein [Acetobacteraceae bacterium]